MRGGPVRRRSRDVAALTLGLTGWAVAERRKAPLVFNIQDVYPDVAIELGVRTNPKVIAASYNSNVSATGAPTRSRSCPTT